MELKTEKKILLLINTGTPDSPEVKDVRRYLSEFLNDPRVIQLPWLLRKILVNLIIIPFRARRSAKLYNELWTENGSPLKINLNNLVSRVQRLAGDEYRVIGAFRYGQPSLRNILRELKNQPPSQIIAFPLFPQYASSTSGSVYGCIIDEIRTWEAIPGLRVIRQFYDHPAFIDSFASQIERYDPRKYDHILFSYHGLPLSHVHRIHPEQDSGVCNCIEKFSNRNEFCYKATCYETTRLLSEKLNLDPAGCSTSFQSRLSKNWLGPFTDAAIKELALSGRKKILIVAPSFVADCLETIIELNVQLRKVFMDNGGNEFAVSASLNDNDRWAEAILKIAEIN